VSANAPLRMRSLTATAVRSRCHRRHDSCRRGDRRREHHRRKGKWSLPLQFQPLTVMCDTRSCTDHIAHAHSQPTWTPAAIAARSRASANSILKFIAARLGSPLAAFLRRPADPRYLANDSRAADVVATLRHRSATQPVRVVSSACSSQGLERCLAVRRFVGGGEPSEMGEPPAVRDGGDGAVGGMRRRQIPVGAAQSDHADVCHR